MVKLRTTSHSNNHRLTIGVLPGWLAYEGSSPDHYLNNVFKGIQSQANLRGCNLLLAWGGGRVVETSRGFPAWPVVASDSDFVPVGPWNTNGLIVLAPLLNKARSAYIQETMAKGHPVLFVAAGEKGPAVTFNNEGGIRQGTTHLFYHGHRKIAFIAGDPNDQGDGKERVEAFRAEIAAAGLELDPRLVAYGKHSYQGGYAAMWEILNSKVEFTAVQASNDISAIGAIRALQEAGRKIPQDVAVIGFDDQQDAVAQIPPLTSVHVPLVEIGAKALDLILANIEQNAPILTTKVDTHLVCRQSCGCMPEEMTIAQPGYQQQRGSLIMSERNQLDDTAFEQVLVRDMLTVLAKSEHNQSDLDFGRLCNELVTTLLECIKTGGSKLFIYAILTVLQEFEKNNLDIHSLQNVISVMRHDLLEWFNQRPSFNQQQLMENLLHEARIAISESVMRIDYRHHQTTEVKTYSLNIFTSRLSASLDKNQTIRILKENLSKIGIRHATVALFESKVGDPVAHSLVISPDPDQKASFLRFPTRKFPPKGLYPPDELLSLALIPLVFQNEPLGYAAFEASDLNAISVIALQLAANLKAARLHTEVIELSILDGLTDLYNRRFLELFLKKEVERCHRYQRGLSVMMLDIDYFKKLNDTFGHPAGDFVLREVAKHLQNRQRKLDIIARYGGDEFVLVLPETEAAGALHLAETIRNEVATLFESKYNLTLSLGVVSMRTEKYSAEDLIQYADRALYVAKRTGRNKVCAYSES